MMSNDVMRVLELERLLYQEARMLDLVQYETWLETLSDRLRYWAPVRTNVEVEDFANLRLLTHFDERKADLAMRVQRIRTGHAHSESPPTRVRRLISNVLVLADEGRSVQVASSFLVTFSRWEGAPKIYSGGREDRWSQDDSGRWLLEERRIVFDLAVVGNLTFFV